MKKILDANIVIRYLTESKKEKTELIDRLFRSEEILILTDVTISEIIWVLVSYYKQDKNVIIHQITALINLQNIKSNKTLILKALEYFYVSNIDWIDAYIAAYAVENGTKEIYSYDKDLDKIQDITRLEP